MIILIEDDPADARVMEVAINMVWPSLQFLHFQCAEDALAFLTIAPEVASERLKPSLIITELDLPGTSGFDFIKIVRSMPSLVSVPIIVLTGSDNSEKGVWCYHVGASSFLVKTFDLEQRIKQVRALAPYLESDVSHPK